MGIDNIDKNKCEEWGGKVEDGVCNLTEHNGKYEEKTVVRSCEDGQEAFEKYTDYYENTLSKDKDSDCVVFIPCGSSKPIGCGGDARKKAESLEKEGITQECDVVIISEPATVIPHDERLKKPAANYDFPPKFAKEENCPEVNEVFTDRLAEFIEKKEYETIRPYLISHHTEIFEKSMEKADTDAEVKTIPPSSYSEKAGRRISDRFATEEQVREKLRKEMKK